MTTTEKAQLFWDVQDPSNPGWYLRYRDSAGNEIGEEIDGDQDADLPKLAEAAWALIPDRSNVGELVVHDPRGDAPKLRSRGPGDWRYV